MPGMGGLKYSFNNPLVSSSFTHSVILACGFSGHGFKLSPGIGKILVDSRGRTLYLFKADHGTKTACTGACAAASARTCPRARRRRPQADHGR